MKRSAAYIPLIAGVALLLSIIIAFGSLVNTVSAEQPEQDTTTKSNTIQDPIPDDATLLKMKVKQLKSFLIKKGPDAECKACTSKQEYIDRIRETADWPDLETEEKKKENEPSFEELQNMFKNEPENEEMKKLRRELEKAGIDGSNFISTAGLKPEELAEKLKGMDIGVKNNADTDKSDL